MIVRKLNYNRFCIPDYVTKLSFTSVISASSFQFSEGAFFTEFHCILLCFSNFEKHKLKDYIKSIFVLHVFLNFLKVLVRKTIAFCLSL